MCECVIANGYSRFCEENPECARGCRMMVTEFHRLLDYRTPQQWPEDEFEPPVIERVAPQPYGEPTRRDVYAYVVLPH